MRGLLRSIILFVVTILSLLPAHGGIVDTWDWTDDPTTGKPRRKLRVKYGFAADAKLGDKSMKDIMDEAIKNWHNAAGDTGWDIVAVGAGDDADIEVKVDPDLNRSAGAETTGTPDKDGRVSGMTITFDPSPQTSDGKAFDWDQAGKNKDDTKNPVSSAKHELSHCLRLDHQGGTRSISKKIKDPQGGNTKDDDVLTISEDDKKEAKESSTKPIRKVEVNGAGGKDADLHVPAFPGGIPVYPTTPEDDLFIAGNAFQHDVIVRLGRTDMITMPSPHTVPNGVSRMVKGVEIEIIALQLQSINPNAFFQVSIPYEDGMAGEGWRIDVADPDYGPVVEQALRPFVWDPQHGAWVQLDPAALGGTFNLDMVNNHAVMTLPCVLLTAFPDTDNPLHSSLFLSIGGPSTIPQSTAVSMSSTSGQPGQTIALKAMVKRTSDGAGLPGEPVYFSVAGSDAGLALTDATGLAILPYMIPDGSAIGYQAMAAGFPGDAFYLPSSGSAKLNVTKASVKITVPTLSGVMGTGVTLQASLRRLYSGDLLAGRQLTFKVAGALAGSAVTDGAGVASLPYTIPTASVPAVQTVAVTFAGDATNRSGTGNGKLNAMTATHLDVPLVQGAVEQTVSISATLTRTCDGAPLASRSVTFSVAGTPIGMATTTSSGVATRTLNIAESLGVGDHPIAVSYAGDSLDQGSTGTGVLRVVASNSVVTVTSLSGTHGKKVTLKAKLTRTSDGLGIGGRKVKFYIDGNLVGTATTTVSGSVSLSYMIPSDATTGAHEIKAVFDGDTAYNAGNGVGTLTVL